MPMIPMVDLRSQYLKIKDEVDAAMQEVIDSTAFIKGQPVHLFEQELAGYLGVKHVIGCGNGTDALQIALMALGLRPGDEVISPSFTFIATVEVIALLGLTPVLVDVDRNHFTLDIDSLRAAITPRTRAIIPVHLFGQCANMDQIMRIAAERGLHVVEDNAQALGAHYHLPEGVTVKAGAMGTIGCTSFFPSKNLGCFGDGGALFTNDDALADEIRATANHGMRVRYHHDRIGVNSRLDTLQAAVLRVKLRHLDAYNQARSQAAQRYDELLAHRSDVLIPQRVEWSSHIYHQYTLRLPHARRADVAQALTAAGIPSMVYYPIPLHRQKAFEPYRRHATVRDFPNTDWLCQTVLSLPMHTELDPEVQRRICQVIINTL